MTFQVFASTERLRGLAMRVSGGVTRLDTGVIGSLIKNGMRSPCKIQIFLMALNNVVALLFGGLSSSAATYYCFNSNRANVSIHYCDPLACIKSQNSTCKE